MRSGSAPSEVSLCCLSDSVVLISAAVHPPLRHGAAEAYSERKLSWVDAHRDKKPQLNYRIIVKEVGFYYDPKTRPAALAADRIHADAFTVLK